MRPIVIIGNWKMYKTTAEATAFVESLFPTNFPTNTVVGLAVPFTAIQFTAEVAKGSKLLIGAQTMSDTKEGPFTGEISPLMLKDAGAKFVLLGHSERRRLFGEDNSLVNRKLKLAFQEGIQPVLCIGETLEERREGKTEALLEEQLIECLDGITSEQLASLWISYEPVWAIGTGNTATPEQAQQVHHYCRQVMAARWGEDVAAQVVIQYGGSVKPDNIKELIEKPDIDGVLVGGASLDVQSFKKIIQSSQKYIQTT